MRILLPLVHSLQDPFIVDLTQSWRIDPYEEQLVQTVLQCNAMVIHQSRLLECMADDGEFGRPGMAKRRVKEGQAEQHVVI